MNRKKKIIYITLLFVVLVSIIGFTFAYIGTRILGNSDSKEMSFTAKKESVTYKEISSTSSGETISPGYEYLKIFTATNTGNVEVKYHIYLDEVENDFIRVQDITYTLYRMSGDNTITTDNLSSAEVIANGTFPIINQYIKTDEVLTNPNDVYTYALKINYNTSTESQDSDSGHIFGFKVQLHTNKDEVYNDKTLLSNIVKNAIEVTDTEEQSGTAKYRPTPTTGVATSVSSNTEADLSHTVDDYGKTFYFRGNVKNNYVNFAEMCWRVVRIAGNGSIKLILEDQDSTCETSDGNWNIPTTTNGSTKTGNFGYTQYAANTLTASDGTTNSSTRYLLNYLNSGTENDKSMATAFKNFQTGPLASYLSYLKVGDWCLNDKAYATGNDNSIPLTNQEILDKQIKSEEIFYDSYVRLIGKSIKEPTLKCNGTVMKNFNDNLDMYVGTLTADEIVYAGGKIGNTAAYYYLINDYQKSNNLYFWLLAPYYFDKTSSLAFLVGVDGKVYIVGLEYNSAIRPAISLKSSIEIAGGTGTQTDPYVIE